MATERSPVLGVSFTRTDTAAAFPLGTIKDSGGAVYQYVEFDGTIAADVCAKVRGAGTYLTTASGNAGEIDGINISAKVDGEFGWIKIRGYHANANVATGTAANAQLARGADANGDFVTATAVNEGGAANVTVLQNSARAKCLEAESGGLADVYLY